MENYLENIVAVSGLPGLYLMEGSRSNGLILKNMDTGMKQFVSVRKHQFTPLRSIAIYTYGDSTPIEELFTRMTDLKPNHDVTEILRSDNKTLTSYFRLVLPDYDEDRVYPSDMKKVLKWFDFLDKRNYFDQVHANAAGKSEEE